MTARTVRPDVALDARETSHTSAGMLAYVRALRTFLPRLASDLRIVEVGRGDNFDRAEQIELPLRLARMRPRLAHFPTPYVPRIIPVQYVVTVHDVIDLEFPQYAKRKVGPYWRWIVGPVLRGARAVITDDDMTVELLQRYVRVDPARVRVIPLGVDAPQPIPAAHVGARPYYFYAGNRRPHKALAALLTAWVSLPDHYEVDMLLTGAEIAGLDVARERGRLIFAGDVGERELWALHRGALAYVHPSLREGFGLPLLEALRCGTPVIAAESATPAVLAPYVHRYPADDVVQLRLLMMRAFEDRDPFREAAGRARDATAYLTWEATVRATSDLYRELLA